MTQKQIADRLRALIPQIDVSTHGDVARGNRVYTDSVVSADKVRELADELDPPAPKPGVVVMWRPIRGGSRGYFGVTSENKAGVFGQFGLQFFEDIEWSKAEVLKPGQIAVEGIR